LRHHQRATGTPSSWKKKQTTYPPPFFFLFGSFFVFPFF
jgi:hypothetical protein